MTTVAVSATTGSQFSLSPQQPAAPFFIFGCPRSGTSLLSAMLGMHPRLAIPQESHFYSGIYPIVHRFGNLRHASTRTRLVREILRTEHIRLGPRRPRCQRHSTPLPGTTSTALWTGSCAPGPRDKANPGGVKKPPHIPCAGAPSSRHSRMLGSSIWSAMAGTSPCPTRRRSSDPSTFTLWLAGGSNTWPRRRKPAPFWGRTVSISCGTKTWWQTPSVSCAGFADSWVRSSPRGCWPTMRPKGLRTLRGEMRVTCGPNPGKQCGEMAGGNDQPGAPHLRNLGWKRPRPLRIRPGPR